MKTWKHLFRHKTVTVFCDNEAAITVLKSGRCRDQVMLACAREIWLVASMNDFVVNPCHKANTEDEMLLPDALSRLHTGPQYLTLCSSYIGDHNNHHIFLTDNVFQFDDYI